MLWLREAQCYVEPERLKVSESKRSGLSDDYVTLANMRHGAPTFQRFIRSQAVNNIRLPRHFKGKSYPHVCFVGALPSRLFSKQYQANVIEPGAMCSTSSLEVYQSILAASPPPIGVGEG